MIKIAKIGDKVALHSRTSGNKHYSLTYGYTVVMIERLMIKGDPKKFLDVYYTLVDNTPERRTSVHHEVYIHIPTQEELDLYYNNDNDRT